MLRAVIIATGLLVGGGIWYWWSMSNPVSPEIQQPPDVQVRTSSASTAKTETTLVIEQEELTQTYKNEEFAFEFKYPIGWEVDERANVNRFVLFSVTARPSGWRKYFNPFHVVIGTHEHADHFVSTVANTTPPQTATVDGEVATKYQYLGETYYTTYLVPSDGYTIFIGNENNELVQDFNNMLASFKFLK